MVDDTQNQNQSECADFSPINETSGGYIIVKDLPLKDRIRRRFYFASANFLAKFGAKGVYRLADIAATFAWVLYKKRRELAISNISERLNLPYEEARVMARSAFTSNMRSFMESILIPGYDYKNANLKIEGGEILDEIHKIDRPVILVTGHLGSWEFITALCKIIVTNGRHGLVIMRRYADPAFNELMSCLRASHGVELVGHRNAVKPILKTLHANGFVAFLVDHHVASGSESLTMPFLGKETVVNKGPAVMATRTGALILPCALFRTDNGHVLHVEPFLDPSTLSGTNDEKIRQICEFYTLAMERLIKMHPEQWFWMHNRWK